MKQIIFLLFIVVVPSCIKHSTKVDNVESEKITTLEIINKANADTCCYKYVELNDVTYILKDNKVIHKVRNNNYIGEMFMASIITLIFVAIISAVFPLFGNLINGGHL